MYIQRFISGKGCCGYFLYTLLFTLFMLWLQFPGDDLKAKARLELNKFTPDWEWQVQQIRLAPSLGLHVRGLEARKMREDANPLHFMAEDLILRPDFARWRARQGWAANYRLTAPAGEITGTVQVQGQQIQTQATMQDIQLDHSSLQEFFQAYERQIEGRLAGDFTSTWQAATGIEVEGDFTIHDGELSLQEPVLGMEKLLFEHLSSHLTYTEGMLQLSQGSMESRLLAAEFSGTVRPSKPFAFSQVDIRGVLQLRPEFLAGFGSSPLVNILRRQTQEGRLPFTITGTVQEPGLVFRGLPADINRQLQRAGQ